MRPFSLRHKKALLDKRLKVSMPPRLRRRVWMLFDQYNADEVIHPIPGDSWDERSTSMCEVERELKMFYGEDPLQVTDFPKSSKPQDADFKMFIEKTYPSRVLDAIEVFSTHVDGEGQANFARDINTAFEDEECSWRFSLAEGHFFQVDKKFLEIELEGQCSQLLKSQGFEGALDEFNKARNALTSGEIRDAIHKACQSFESTLVTITGQEKGAVGNLLQEFVKAKYCNDLPKEAKTAFVKNVLPALGIMRNKLGGHGQGTDVVEVPKVYGQLALHLAAAFNCFVMEKYIEQKPDLEPEPVSADLNNDHVPF